MPDSTTESTTESTTIVLLVRHGENDWVGSDRLAGRTPGVHLNDTGRKQACDLAAILAKQPIQAVYSSPLERCLETAQPTAEALGLPIVPFPGILEVDYGTWQGGNLKELAKLPEWGMVQHYPSAFRFPGGESLRETQARAIAALEEVQAGHPNQLVALFSHADVIRLLLSHYLGVPLDLFQRVVVATASVNVVAFHGRRPTVLAMNYVAELPHFEIKSRAEAAPSEDQSARGEADPPAISA